MTKAHYLLPVTILLLVFVLSSETLLAQEPEVKPNPFGLIPLDVDSQLSEVAIRSNQLSAAQNISMPLIAEPSGRIAFVSNRDGNLEIYSMNGDGSDVTRLTNNSALDLPSGWSPDGQQIVFHSDRDGDVEIYTMNADGSGVRQLTHNSVRDLYPEWSPDGKKISFGSDRDGGWDLYTMDTDGSDVARLTYSGEGWADHSWSPDGSKIAYTEDRSDNLDIYLMNADGSGEVRLTHNSDRDFYPSWSPDGERIAFTSGRDGDSDIFVMNADGSNITRLTHSTADDWAPAWSPDGKYIAFSSDRGGDQNVMLMNDRGAEYGVARLTAHQDDDRFPVWTSTEQIDITPTPEPISFDYWYEIGGIEVNGIRDFSLELGKSMKFDAGISRVEGGGEHGGISISFPNLTGEYGDTVSAGTYSSSKADIGILSIGNASFSDVDFYKPDEDVIYHSEGNRRFYADNLLVELDYPVWHTGDRRDVSLTITPKQVGEFTILMRFWICSDEYTNCSRLPSDGEGEATDQQGYDVGEIIVKVTRPDEESALPIPEPAQPEEAPALRATIDSCGVDSEDPHRGFYQPEEASRARLSARVTNHSAVERDLQLLGQEFSNLTVVWHYWSSDGLIGITESEPRYVNPSGQLNDGSGETYEFTVRLPEDFLLPSGVVAIQCVLYFDSVRGYEYDVLEDYSGRESGVSHGYITISEDAKYAERLWTDWIIDGDGGRWDVDIIISPPLSVESEARKLIVDIERLATATVVAVDGRELLRDKTLGDHEHVAISLSIPESVWVDYGEIKKYVAKTDGVYEEYTKDSEQFEYQQAELVNAVVEAILGFIEGAHEVNTLIGLTATILKSGDIEVPSPGEHWSNCRDDVDVVTLAPGEIQSLSIMRDSPKRLRIEIPVSSLDEDDYLMLTVMPAQDLQYRRGYNDLLQSGDTPVCEP